jgi:sugar lactone lactonase YvrE
LLLWSGATLQGFAQGNSVLPIPTAHIAAGVAPAMAQTPCTTGYALDNGQKTGDGCPATQAVLKGPYSTVTDSYGNVYIADNGNLELRVIYQGNPLLAKAISASYAAGKITMTPIPGYIYGLVGGGLYYDLGATGGPGYTTINSGVSGVALDADGNVFYGDSSHIQVFYVSGTKVLNLFKAAGAPTTAMTPGYEYTLNDGVTVSGYNGDGGPAFSAQIDGERGLLLDANENLYIADTANDAIRMVSSSTGLISTVVGGPGCMQGKVGSCTSSSTGDGGLATSATIPAPYDMAFDAYGNVYIAQYSSGRVRALYLGNGSLPGVTSPQKGYIYTVAGGGTTTTSGALASQISFSSATGIGFDGQGQLYVADAKANKVWEIDAASQVGIIIAGGGVATSAGGACLASNSSGSPSTDTLGDGCPGIEATLATPEGKISFDAQGNLYIADYGDSIVRQLSPQIAAFPATKLGSSSSVQTVAFAMLAAEKLSAVTLGVQGVGGLDYNNAGSSTCAASASFAVGATCLLNISFTPSFPGTRLGYVQLANASTVLKSAYLSGVGTGPGLTIDSGTQSVAGSGLAPNGIASGPDGSVYVADKTSNSLMQFATASASTATTLIAGLSAPAQVAIDGEGNVAVADSGNNRVAIYNKAYQSVSYLTGLNSPAGVVADSAGDLFVADTGNNRIVMYSVSGSMTVIAANVSKPTRLTLDSNGNLYIMDTGNGRVVEIAQATGAQTTINTGSITPIALSLDSAGDLYLLDGGNLNVSVLSPSGTSTVLFSGLKQPTDLELDTFGNVYVSDLQTGAISLNRQVKSIAFGASNVGASTLAISYTLTNVGNTMLTFSNSAIEVTTGSATAFATTPFATNGCTSTTLAVGSACLFQSAFSPSSTGSYSASVTFPANVGSANTATVLLTGTGVVLTKTNTTVALSSPSSASGLVYGTPITISVTVIPVSGTGLTGTVAILVNGVQQKVFTSVSGPLSYTFTPNAGSLLVSAAYSGDTQFASSNNSLSLVVAPAPTTTGLTIAGSLSTATPSVTLTAQVTSATPGVSGPVSFMNGSTPLGIVSINAQGVATITLSNPALNNLAFTASFAGNSNFATSTSAIETLGGDYGLINATPLQIVQGGIANGSFTLVPYFNLAGSVSFACTGLPANAICRFTPQSVTFAGANDSATTVQLQAFTNISTTLASNEGGSSRRLKMNILAAAAFGLLLFGRRQRSRFMAISLLPLSLLAVGVFMGCGSGMDSPSYVTPPGTYQLTVTASSSTAPTHTISVGLLVAPAN